MLHFLIVSELAKQWYLEFVCFGSRVGEMTLYKAYFQIPLEKQCPVYHTEWSRSSLESSTNHFRLTCPPKKGSIFLLQLTSYLT